MRVLGSLPDVHTVGLHVASLEVWVDRHQVVHRMAISFRGTVKVSTHKPVSKAALRELQRAKRVGQASPPLQADRDAAPASQMNLAGDRPSQAERHAFQIRRETEVIDFTMTFSAIGQPQHITRPGTPFPSAGRV